MKNEKLVILGGGESGVGTALLGKEKGYEVFVSDKGIIKEKYKKVLIHNEIEFEDGQHTEAKILNADLVMKSPGIPEKVAFSETGNPLNEKQPPKEPNTMSIRTATWKLIYNQYNNTKELYNLELDPDENKNLIETGENIEEILWVELKRLINKHD